MESRKRSVAKALTWRAGGSLTTAALVYVFTGELKLAAAIGGIEVVAKMVIYYLHERVWSMVRWGREP